MAASFYWSSAILHRGPENKKAIFLKTHNNKFFFLYGQLKKPG